MSCERENVGWVPFWLLFKSHLYAGERVKVSSEHVYSALTFILPLLLRHKMLLFFPNVAPEAGTTTVSLHSIPLQAMPYHTNLYYVYIYIHTYIVQNTEGRKTDCCSFSCFHFFAFTICFLRSRPKSRKTEHPESGFWHPKPEPSCIFQIPLECWMQGMDYSGESLIFGDRGGRIGS